MKIASMKNAKPSIENGMPITAPLLRMKTGQSKPSSNASVVPETAPIANSTSIARDQIRASR